MPLVIVAVVVAYVANARLGPAPESEKASAPPSVADAPDRSPAPV
jgi:hypothetical protein